MKHITRLYSALVSKRPVLMRSTSCIENLSCYRQRGIVEKQGEQREYIKDAEISFDIERTIFFNGNPPKYSFMITAVYDQNKTPSTKHIKKCIDKWKGFTNDSRTEYQPHYISGRHNFFVNLLYLDGKGTVGVIQDEPVNTLEEVVDSILPNAIRMYNTINKERKLPVAIVKESIKLARNNDEYIMGEKRN